MNKEYLECPKCGSEEIDCGAFETDVDYATRTAECTNCHFSWIEIYDFHHNEDNI